jgi:hypothetical protein
VRRIGNSLTVVTLALLGVVALAVSNSIPIVAQLLAATVLVMGGTELPSPDQTYVDNQTQRYIVPYFGAIPEANRHGVHTPEQFWPVYGSLTFDKSVAAGVTDLNNTLAAQSGPVIILGYSQSARIETIEKNRLIAQHDQNGAPFPDYSYVLVSNVNKPNGGILERFNGWSIPILGVTFDGATATDSSMPTKDVSYLYDGWSDFPVYPLDLLADVNAIAGIVYLHNTYPTQNATPVQIGTKGDTTYYGIEPPILPILMPLQQLGVPKPLLLALNEPLKVLVEAGYRRDINPGDPTPAYLIPVINPITLAKDFVESIPVGIDDALQSMNLGRPLGTTAPGIYGVGGNDTELQGLPPGFIPLGKPAPTAPSTKSTQTPNTQASPLKTDPLAPKATDPMVTPDTSDTTSPAVDTPKPLKPKARGPLTLLTSPKSLTPPKSPKLPKLPSAHQTDDQPIKRVLKALTGQRPQKTTETTDNTSPSKPAHDEKGAA